MPPNTEQELAAIWTIFSDILVLLFAFSLVYAVLIRYAANKGVEGQTAWAVVIGVGITVIAFIPIFGLIPVFMLLAGFSASGFFVIIEYLLRVYQARKKDIEDSNVVQKRMMQSDDG